MTNADPLLEDFKRVLLPVLVPTRSSHQRGTLPGLRKTCTTQLDAPSMPRALDVTSESDTERVQPGSMKKTYASKKRRASSASESDVQGVEKEVHEEPEETAAEGEEEDEEEEEEYEIEKILDAKKGQFTGGRMGYFVKWKNYGEEHNSWVDERDAGNAKELIERFWAEKKKKLGPRKSEPLKLKPKLVEKHSRRSLADMDSSAEPESHGKKRGRPKKDELPSDKMDTRDKDEDEQRARKKVRKSNGVALEDSKGDSDDDEIIGDMKKHIKAPSWEELIETIDTVERQDDGELYVFFTLKADKKRVRENSRICAEKFPQKLIMFYESNLRWKAEDEPTDA